MAPHLSYGLLTDSWIVGAGAYTKSFGVGSYHPNYKSLILEVIRELKEHNIKIHVYTV